MVKKTQQPQKPLVTLFWKYSFRHIHCQRSTPDAVNKEQEEIDPNTDTRWLGICKLDKGSMCPHREKCASSEQSKVVEYCLAITELWHYIHVADDGLVWWREEYKKVFQFQLEKERVVWGRLSTYCIDHRRKLTLSALIMFKTVSAINLSHQKRLIGPPASPVAVTLKWIYPFIQSVALQTRRILSRTHPASLSQGTLQRCGALSKASEGSRGTRGTAGWWHHSLSPWKYALM